MSRGQAMKTEISSTWRLVAGAIAGVGTVTLAYSLPLGLASIGAGLLLFAVLPIDWARRIDSIHSVTTPVRFRRKSDLVIARCGIAALLGAAIVAILHRG
jgi:hypothetical protein